MAQRMSLQVDVSGELSVELDVARWTARLTIRDAEGTTRTWMLSADSYLTQNDGLWFGTLDEYDEEMR